MQSLAVTGSDITFTLQPNSTTTIQSTDRIALLTGAIGSASATYSCITGSSILNLTGGTVADAVTVTVGSVACDAASQTGQTSTSGGGSSSSSSTSSSSSGAPVASVAVTPTVNTIASTEAKQIADLQTLIASLSAQIAALGGNPVGLTVAVTATTFGKPLSVGTTNADVKKLQKILNADPDTKIASTGAGSPGKETTLYGALTKKAVQKFQVKYKIAKPGDVGYGIFGPKTRAKMNEVAKSLGM